MRARGVVEENTFNTPGRTSRFGDEATTFRVWGYGMYKNFWYACGQSTSITKEPKRVKILGQNLVAYRTEAGEPVVMSDLCIHRGGSLSNGSLEGDDLRCPYHGWKFTTEGQCNEIPSNGKDKPVPRRARVDAYPSADKYGFTWAFLGDLPESERPALPEFPEWDESFKPVYGEFTWNANFRRVVENSLDPAHASWVHKDSFGNKQDPEVPEFEIKTSELGGGAHMTLISPKLKGLWGRKRKVRNEVHLYNGYLMPNVTIVNMVIGKLQTRLYNIAVPVDEETTITYWVVLRDFFKSSLFDGDTHRRTMNIFYEDAPVVENQRPELIPEEISAELHVRADRIQIAYRKMCQAIEAKGWGIDLDQYRTLEGKKATIIPCPARRKEKEQGTWVFPEVPMSSVKDKAKAAANEPAWKIEGTEEGTRKELN